RVPPREVTFLPRHTKNLSNNAMAVDDRFRSQVPNPRLNCNTSVRLDKKESVISGRAPIKTTQRNAQTVDFGTNLLRLVRNPLLPTELLCAAIKRVFNKATGRVRALAVHLRPEICFPFRAINSPDRNLIKPQLAGRLRHYRFHHYNALHPARRALSPAWRRVRHHGNAAPTHCGRLIEQRNDSSRGRCIAHCVIRPCVADHEHVYRGNAPIFCETNFVATQQTWPATPNERFFLTADAHH